MTFFTFFCKVWCMSTNTIPATEARAKLTQLIDEVEETNRRVIITKKGKSKVALISIDELEGWEETLNILENNEEVKSIRKGLLDLKKGEVVEWKSAKE